MRLFVAVEIDTGVAQAAAALIAELRAQVTARAPRARLTWLPAERLHLTLAFIGNIDEARLPAIEEALRPPFSASRFDICFRGVGVFPERGQPRVLWVGIDTGRANLVALAAEVATRLRRAGVALEDRGYQPHLPLARVRDAGDFRRAMVTAGREQPVLGTSIVGAVTLFESRLSPAGPVYRAIERMPLSE